MSDINAILDRHGIKRCGDSSCIFGPRGGMMTNGGCRCGHDDPGAPSRPTRLSRQLAHAVTEQAAEIARLTAELATARAVPADVEAAILTLVGVTICETSRPPHSADDPSPPMDVARNALRAAIARAISDATAAGLTTAVKSVEAIATDSAAVGYSEDWRAAIDRVLTRLRAVRENGGPLTSTCDATAARGTVGGLLATAPDLSDYEGQYVADRIGLTYELSTDAGRGRAIKAMRAAEEIIARGPLPKGG